MKNSGKIIPLFFIDLLIIAACNPSAKYPYQNPGLPVEERIGDLMNHSGACYGHVLNWACSIPNRWSFLCRFPSKW